MIINIILGGIVGWFLPALDKIAYIYILHPPPITQGKLSQTSLSFLAARLDSARLAAQVPANTPKPIINPYK